MKKILLLLSIIFKPRYWFMNENYAKHHDLALNSLMDNYDFDYSTFNGHDIKLGNQRICIDNFPYAVGIVGLSKNTRPSRLTIMRMEKKLSKDISKSIL